MESDEISFFQTLQEIVGAKHLKSKAIGLKITPSDIFLDKAYRRYDFPEQINLVFLQLLKKLQSTSDVGSGTLSHHIDGMIVDHPEYGSRIVEFDEEQHFNTFREVSLQQLSTCFEPKYSASYRSYCQNVDHFNQMLRKHRLKVVVESVPSSVQAFIALIQENTTSTSGYVEPKHGFDFVGGRIAQRAYYDTLRDVAHLSEKNSSFRPPFRFAKVRFENEANLTFSQISSAKLRMLIESQMNELV